MRTTAGIFNSRADAERAVESLRASGVPDERISLLSPGTSAEEFEQSVPTTETEQPGMGKALGGAVGGALGVAGGLHLGAAAASLFVPGVGPILAAGIIGAALLGAGGAATGVAAGGALENNIAEGLPHDELYVYEDALRQGRTVVVAVAETDEQGEAAQHALEDAGAESLDAARESWWVGLRDAEAAEYTGQGGDFGSDEAVYRRGFAASLHPRMRGRSFVDAGEELRGGYESDFEHEAFRRGYERGRAYHQSLQEKYRQGS
ncbi:MAG TPA: hypothetical protein VNA19_10465 [Pyrinomonadaceae bacterium]|jgi:hypothetical protein|nr:hypothetical protein [Pyrinomonadaceae bacterium]